MSPGVRRGGIVLLFALAACAGPRRYQNWSYTPPAATPEWPVASAGEVGLDERILQGTVQSLADQGFVQIRSLLVAREGALVLEVYDRPSRRDRPQDLRSTTKSITGLVVADLHVRGAFDLSAPISAQLPDLPDTPEWSATTTSHLLSMRSGLACVDRDRGSPGQEDRMYRSRDWVAFWMNVPHLDGPGTTARYCTGNLVAAGRVAERATQTRFADLADAHLFGPLGLSAEWATYDGGRGTDTGGHLRLTPRALARVGQHLLDVHAGRATGGIQRDAFVLATTLQTELDGRGYGLGWWLDTIHTSDGRTLDLWYTSGNGGQHLFLLPDLEMLVVFTGGAYNHPDARAPFAVMGQGLLPAAGVQPVAPPAD